MVIKKWNYDYAKVYRKGEPKVPDTEEIRKGGNKAVTGIIHKKGLVVKRRSK